MWAKVLVYISAILVAFAILFASILRTASVRYVVNDSVATEETQFFESEIGVNYYLPYPGRILPDSPFWPLKAMRDRVWLWVTTNPTRKVELKLLFADKRIGSSKILFRKGKMEKGLSILAKAEKYLEEASLDEEKIRKEGFDTTDVLIRISNSSLKHYQVMQEIINMVPCEVKPAIIEIQNYSKKTYERGRNGLLDKGETPPENPFNW